MQMATVTGDKHTLLNPKISLAGKQGPSHCNCAELHERSSFWRCTKLVGNTVMEVTGCDGPQESIDGRRTVGESAR